MIDFLLKYDSTAHTDQKENIKLIDRCIEQHEDLLGYAMKLIGHVIQSNFEINHPESLQDGFNIFQQIKSKLIKINRMKDDEEMKNDVLSQIPQAQVYVAFADLA